MGSRTTCARVVHGSHDVQELAIKSWHGVEYTYSDASDCYNYKQAGHALHHSASQGDLQAPCKHQC
jgi:hypothetical protein